MAESLTIRTALASDIPAVHRIEQASFSDPWSEASFRSLIGHPFVRGSVAELVSAEDAGRLVGYCFATIAAGEAELLNVAVTPDSKGKGIGGALLDDLMDAAAFAGVKEIYLEVRESNAPAIALYEGRGFQRISVRAGYYTFPVEDAIVMCRSLD